MDRRATEYRTALTVKGRGRKGEEEKRMAQKNKLKTGERKVEDASDTKSTMETKWKGNK